MGKLGERGFAREEGFWELEPDIDGVCNLRIHVLTMIRNRERVSGFHYAHLLLLSHFFISAQ